MGPSDISQSVQQQLRGLQQGQRSRWGKLTSCASTLLPCVCFLFVSRQASGGPNPKTQNGLLSPPQQEKLTNSQTSLCEILQEKGRWAGVSLDQSALLPLRFKNIREKTDAHFVDVIKEDR